jgi:hypothetical protein
MRESMEPSTRIQRGAGRKHVVFVLKEFLQDHHVALRRDCAVL